MKSGEVSLDCYQQLHFDHDEPLFISAFLKIRLHYDPHCQPVSYEGFLFYVLESIAL